MFCPSCYSKGSTILYICHKSQINYIFTYFYIKILPFPWKYPGLWFLLPSSVYLKFHLIKSDCLFRVSSCTIKDAGKLMSTRNNMQDVFRCQLLKTSASSAALLLKTEHARTDTWVKNTFFLFLTLICCQSSNIHSRTVITNNRESANLPVCLLSSLLFFLILNSQIKPLLIF